MTVKLVSVESYISEFSIVSMENPDIYKCRNSQGLFPSNSQTPFNALSFICFCSNFHNVRFKMTSRGCVNSSESFCNICGEFVVKKQQRNVTDFVCGDLKVIPMILRQQGGWDSEVVTQNFPIFFVNWIVMLKPNTGTRKCGRNKH